MSLFKASYTYLPPLKHMLCLPLNLLATWVLNTNNSWLTDKIFFCTEQREVLQHNLESVTQKEFQSNLFSTNWGSVVHPLHFLNVFEVKIRNSSTNAMKFELYTFYIRLLENFAEILQRVIPKKIHNSNSFQQSWPGAGKIVQKKNLHLFLHQT